MKPQRPPAYIRYGRPSVMQEIVGATPENALPIAAVILFSASIEYHLERYLWQVNGIQPKGIKPPTDGKPVSKWIDQLNSHAQTLPVGDGRLLLTKWCDAAAKAFKLRNDIAHGIPIRMEGTINFNRNPAWQGVLRGKDPSSFWVQPGQLELLRDCMAVLFRIVAELQLGKHKLDELASMPDAMQAVKDAASALSELADPMAYNPSFEKY